VNAISTRPIGPEDWQVWRRLRLDALRTDPEMYGSTYAGTLAKDTEEYWRGILSSEGVCVIAEDADHNAVGMARVFPLPIDGESLPHIISVWVDPAARGRGAGGAVIEACLDWVRCERSASAVRLNVKKSNAVARRVYERAGFSVVGPDPEDPSEFVMQRGSEPGTVDRSVR
jgi:ribosomal protein S18 acetylase RimI-like enzyme